MEKQFLVIFATQTGNAQEVAERIGREGIFLGLNMNVSSFNSIRFKNFMSEWVGTDRIVVFVASTTGQGEMPESMRRFWRKLCLRSLESTFFSGLNFAVIGLGDSSYEKYNFAGKKLFRRLEQLGGTPIADLCLADDQHDRGYDAEVDPFLKNLWLKYNEDAVKLLNNFKPEPNFLVSNKYLRAKSPCPMTDKQFVFEFIEKNERVTSPDHFQDVRMVTISHSEFSSQYQPGDVLMVIPENSNDNINQFFELLPQIDRNSSVYLGQNTKLPWSTLPVSTLEMLGTMPWRWELIVQKLLDIQSIPKRHFFSVLAFLSTNELEKEKLQEFSSAEGQQDLLNYCNRPRRNILEVLQDFPHTRANITEEFVFNLIPFIKPRPFSIASSMRTHPRSVQILVAVVNYHTKLKAPRYGLCSNWLAKLKPGDKVPVSIKSGSFIFPPESEDCNLIMIGPGTGCAPFRSLISDRWDKGQNLILFFGCRHHSKDYFFEKEWTKLKSKNKLQLFLAFSRDETFKQKYYVQDQLKDQSDLIVDCIKNKRSFIFVAGNAKDMPKDVENALVDIFTEGQILNPTKIIPWLKETGHYQTEVWS